MLLIPIGRDEAEIRRHAWVSYTIIALNILIFLGCWFASRGVNQDTLNAKWEDTVKYLGNHPWLKTPPALERFLPEDFEADLKSARANIAANHRGPSAYDMRQQQAELDAMTKQLVQMVREAEPNERFGYVPAHPTTVTLLASMFLHAGLMHLIGNLLFFFCSGPFIEDVFGRPLFAALYLSGGIMAAWAHAWASPGSVVPLIGASGAIAAIMGAYLVRFYRSKVEFFFMPFWWRPTLSFRFFIPAFVVLPLWFLWQFYQATDDKGGAGVAFWAHVGGFAYGAVIAGVVKLSKYEQQWVDPFVEKETTWKQNEHLVAANEARFRHDFDRARHELKIALREEPNNVDAMRSWFELAFETENVAEAGECATRLLDYYAKTGEMELATELLRETSSMKSAIFPEKFYVRAASILERAGDKEWAIDMYDELILRYPDGAGAIRALMQSAKLYRQAGRTDQARLLLRQAEAHPACTQEWKKNLETQLADLDGAPKMQVRSSGTT